MFFTLEIQPDVSSVFLTALKALQPFGVFFFLIFLLLFYDFFLIQHTADLKISKVQCRKPLVCMCINLCICLIIIEDSKI